MQIQATTSERGDKFNFRFSFVRIIMGQTLFLEQKCLSNISYWTWEKINLNLCVQFSRKNLVNNQKKQDHRNLDFFFTYTYQLSKQGSAGLNGQCYAPIEDIKSLYWTVLSCCTQKSFIFPSSKNTGCYMYCLSIFITEKK